MASNKDYYHALEVYRALCASLDEMDWVYQKDDEKLLVSFGVSGHDVPMSFVALFDADRQILRLLSFFPFNAPTDRIIEMAVAVSVINYRLAMGSFNLNLGSGEIYFRLNSSFRDSLISTELIQSLVSVTCSTIDEYNDKLLALGNDEMTIQEFIRKYSD